MDRLTQFCNSIFDINLSEVSIDHWQLYFARNLTNYEETVKVLLLKQDTLHADEIGIRINKLNMWLF